MEQRKTHARLEAWGAWCNRGQSTTARGYPRSTQIGRACRDGGVLASASGPRPVDIDLVAERMELLIVELSKRYPRSARVLVLQYVYFQGLRAVAKEMCVSTKTVNTWQREGRAWLDGAWMVGNMDTNI